MKNLIHILFLIPIALFAQDWHEEERTYEYDNLNRLKKAVFHNGFAYNYTYDNLGNRLGKTFSVELDEDDFNIISYDIQECTLGRIAIEFEKRNDYVIEFTNNQTGEIAEFGTIEESLTIPSLEIGTYNICITINSLSSEYFEQCFENIEINDISDTSHLTPENYSFKLYDNFYESNGTIRIDALEDVDCHDFIVKITDLDNTEIIHEGDFFSTEYIYNLSFGYYKVSLTVENIPSNQYEYIHYLDVRPEDDEVMAYQRCSGSERILYRLDDIGQDYPIIIYDDVNQIEWQGLIDNNHYFGVEYGLGTSFFTEIEFPQLPNSTSVFYNLLMDKLPPFEVETTINYSNNPSITISFEGGLNPYYVSLWSRDYLYTYFEEWYQNEESFLTIPLQVGSSFLKVEDEEFCNDGFYQDIIIPLQYAIYPNPTEDILNVLIPINTINIEKRIDVIDMIGRRVLSQSFNNTPVIQLDVKKLSKATYIINVYDDTEQFLWQSKFIKK